MVKRVIKNIFLIVLLILVIITGVIGFLFRDFITPSFVMGKHLLILNNEYEARPCGGFITAFGELQFFPPKLSLKNAYHYEAEGLGKAPEPLRQLTGELKFWDLGLDADLGTCSARIRRAYEQIEDTDIEHVILVNFGVLEQIFKLVGIVEMEGQQYTSENLFALLSRSVADTDRHDEISLQNRKKPLVELGKSIGKKWILNPLNPIRTGFSLRNSIQNGDFYVHGITPERAPNIDKEIAVIEWNLGGAKSSRYLQKELKINMRQNKNMQWNAKIDLNVSHDGQFDEPLSTYWKGVIEVHFPRSFSRPVVKIPLELKPGDSFSQSFEFSGINLLTNEETGQTEFGIFKARGQDLLVDLSISAYPQQTLIDTNLHTKENMGSYYGPLRDMNTCFSWKAKKDISAPFVTLHTFIPKLALNDTLQGEFERSPLVAEIHFNESVFLGAEFSIKLIDRNYENTITEHPDIMQYKLLEDQRTLLIGLRQPRIQPEERFHISLTDVRDGAGNEIDQDMQWTLIQR